MNTSRMRQLLWQDLANALNALEIFEEVPILNRNIGQTVVGLTGSVIQGQDGRWTWTGVTK